MGTLATHIPFGETTTDAGRQVSAPATGQLAKLRCCRCSRTIARISDGQLLRTGQKLEIKCGACNALNYLVGTESS